MSFFKIQKSSTSKRYVLYGVCLAALSSGSVSTVWAEEVKSTTTTTTTTVQQSAVIEPLNSVTVPATTRTDAIMKARLGAGRANPFATPSGLLKTSEINTAKAIPKAHVPPPPKFTETHLAPPPPPTEVTLPGYAKQAVGSAGMGAPEAELPEPPEKPLIAEKMKLVGVVADKAFFTFTDLELKRMNKFPSTVVLANGEQFESVHLVSVAPNSVVLEEDGERITKELERIR
ncbi:MAG TPA: hypothetical protein V6C76_13500 [Drouetiella sp.]